MSKLVLKTIAITLASVIGACLLTFGALSLFAPATVARFSDSMGNSSVAVFFYEKQYKKTNDIDDLSILVLKLQDQGETVKEESYLKEMISRSDFEEFCKSQNQNQTDLDSREYYYGAYSITLCKNGKLDDAINFGKEYVEDFGYTSLNPLRLLIGEYKNDKIELAKVRSGIMTVTVNLSGEQLTLALGDLVKLDGLLN